MHFEIAVVGAGPAGATCAVAALQNGASRVALIDTETFPRDKCCGDGIGPGAVALLEKVGAGHVLADRTPIEHISLSSPSGHLAKGHVPTVGGSVSRGYAIPRLHFDDGLFRHALAAGATDLTGWRCADARFDDARWTLELTQAGGGKQTITADVLIGADGARSKVRRILGEPLNADEHSAAAIRIYARSTGPSFDALHIGFSEDLNPGYGWLFPTTPNTANIGVGMGLAAFKAAGMSLETLLADYHGTLGDDLVFDEASVSAFILPFASQMPRLAHGAVHAALIGDAGSMINPLSGEGIFYGMYAGELVGRLLGQRLDAASPEPAAAALENYESQFRAKFAAHFQVNRAMKEATQSTLCDMVVKAAARDGKVLGDLLAVIMGDKSYVNRGTFLRIIARNLLPF